MDDSLRLSASVDALETNGAWVVSVSLLDATGHELHRQISEPVESEQADRLISNREQSLQNLGIPVTLTNRAESLHAWWDTDRFAILYQRHGHEERVSEPTLERAWSTADGISEYGTGYVYEIRATDGDRLLYSHRDPMKGWVREADDLPPIDELEAAAKT
jgi:hypothetical protein